ncbi:hypothetical protein BOX15_Mlig031512g4 [Macrostomum lignano]|uniref:FAD-binding FR-type domain-containing protein n=1 Tax=Macrostomum lignano TaxID=282301 RepID=A0A267EG40_9PLAT|nr:hypothetical protein BOX15_Mlig031512g4 [Macrostomum lignano]
MVTKFGAIRWCHNEGPRTLVLIILLLVNVIIFAVTLSHYEQSDAVYYHRLMLGHSLAFARASAACLNFNCALVALPVCRNLLHFLRYLCVNKRLCKRNVRRLIDDNISLHRALAWLICFHAALHAASHYLNIERFVHAFDLPAGGNSSAGGSLLRTLSLLPGHRGINPVQRAGADPLVEAAVLLPGWTGLLLLCLLVAIVASAATAVKRARFETFWYTHKLFFLFYLLLLVHGMAGVVRPQSNLAAHKPAACASKFQLWGSGSLPECPVPTFSFAGSTTWMWLVAPAAIYAIEKLLRVSRRCRRVEVVRAVQHPSRVMELRLRCPGFAASPGEYVFLLVPEASQLQWHPFTLTSAPDDPYISVHIRTVGDWTKQVEQLYSQCYGKGDLTTGERDLLPRIYLDGPYGTASDGVTQYSVSVLIGCGIGVTPFASVLRDVWHQAGKTRSLRKLKRLYFYWICPDCRAFEWFAALLQDLERDLQRMDGDDYAQLLDIRVHLTGSVETRQAREIASREGDEADCLTGLRTRTHYGRPNWDLELRGLAAKHPDTSIGIFFCGPGQLAKDLNGRCNEFSNSTSSVFYFNKENF